MDQEAVGNIVLLAIVTLISVVQNGKDVPAHCARAQGRVCLMAGCKSALDRCVCVPASVHALSPVFLSP